jgi:hypothetical protein
MKKGKLQEEKVAKISIVARDILTEGEIRKLLAGKNKKKRRISN